MLILFYFPFIVFSSISIFFLSLSLWLKTWHHVKINNLKTREFNYYGRYKLFLPFIYVATVFFAMAILSLSVIGIISWYFASFTAGVLLLFLLFSIENVKRLVFLRSSRDGEVDMPVKSVLRLAKYLKPALVVVTIFGIMFFIGWALSGMCICLVPTHISFSINRVFSKDPCKSSICYVYLTIPENPSNSMIVMFHSGVNFQEPSVRLSLKSMNVSADSSLTGDTVNVYRAKKVRLTSLHIERYVYVAYLSKLVSATDYYFAAYDEEAMLSTKEYKFRTLPGSLEGDNTIRFSAGGDSGLSTSSEKVLRNAVSKEPYFLMIGGDITYANGIKYCYERMDKWFSMWQEISITPNKYMVPLLTSIGNHEAGMDFYSSIYRTSFYNYYFVHSFPSNELVDMLTYHVHNISGSVVLVLDSCVLVPSDTVQPSFIDMHLSKNYLWKMALYHAPLYPSVRSFTNSISESLRRDWGPLFDKYHLHVGFENHDHAYKRTHFIKAGEKTTPQDGTLYLGDGAIGAEPRTPHYSREYLATSKSINFHFDVQISNDAMRINAIDVNGIYIDSITLHNR